MAKAKVENPTERDAMLYLEDQAYTAMLGYKEPVRSAEIIGAIGKDYYSSKLLRHILSTSERFAEIDRRWDLEIRYEDKQRPLKRVLKDIVAQYGQPLTAQQVANELASIYERPADYYESLAAKMLADEEDFFEISDGLFGLSDWVLIIESDSEEDVIFDNGIDEKRIAELEKAAAKVNWQGKDIAKEVAKMIDAAKSPVENIMIEFFSWRALGEEFNSAEIF